MVNDNLRKQTDRRFLQWGERVRQLTRVGRRPDVPKFDSPAPTKPMKVLRALLADSQILLVVSALFFVATLVWGSETTGVAYLWTLAASMVMMVVLVVLVVPVRLYDWWLRSRSK